MHGDSWDVLDFVHCSQFHPKLLHSVFCQHFYYKYYHALFSCLLVLCHANSLCFPLMLDERVSSDLKKNLMQARLDKKLTQAQLAQVPHRNIRFQNLQDCALRTEESFVWPST